MNNIIIKITDELQRAESLYPDFPEDIIHRVSIMQEESGEAIRAALNHVYHGEEISKVEEELIQTAAMCIRCLISIEEDKIESGQAELF